MCAGGMLNALEEDFHILNKFSTILFDKIMRHIGVACNVSHGWTSMFHVKHLSMFFYKKL